MRKLWVGASVCLVLLVFVASFDVLPPRGLQAQVVPARGVVVTPTDPSGTCGSVTVALSASSGNMFYCNQLTRTWAAVSGSGGSVTNVSIKNVTACAPAGASTTAYACSPTTAAASLANLTGNVIDFTPDVTSTTAGSTLAVSGLTAKTILTANGQSLAAGELVAGVHYHLTYNGTAFQRVTEELVAGGSGCVTVDRTTNPPTVDIGVATAGAGCVLSRTGTNDVTGTMNLGGASRTVSARASTGSPNARDNCSAIGETYFQTNATAGSNWWGCTATGTPGTWTLQGGASTTTENLWMVGAYVNSQGGGNSPTLANSNATVPQYWSGSTMGGASFAVDTYAASWNTVLHDNWNSGTVILEIYSTLTANNSGTGVTVFDVQTQCTAPNASVATSYNATQAQTITLTGAQYLNWNRTTISSLTKTGCSPGYLLQVKLTRVSQTGDVLEYPIVGGLRLKYVRTL